jgi:DNA replication initiation complex subunit (GINS family)
VLSFEELRDAQRKERSSPGIQPLKPEFWKEVAEYMSNKMAKYQELSEGSSRFTDKVLAKFEREMRNAARVIVELYDLRERKILLLAWSEVATEEKVDTRPLTPEEGELFSRMVQVSGRVRQDVLDKALAGEASKIKAVPGKKEAKKKGVEILEDVQAFMGTDLNLYGPYSKGENVELPEKYAKLLIDKGKAKASKG